MLDPHDIGWLIANVWKTPLVPIVDEYISYLDKYATIELNSTRVWKTLYATLY